ncbi:MAG: ATP-binding cassette domain-containing protein [Candidatus Cloacimonetes bacterium]|nr:ATP-binding cassette domain-containing protein [Candidatus Cloacimonadota bacterium]
MLLLLNEVEIFAGENLLLKIDDLELEGRSGMLIIGQSSSGKSLLLKTIFGEYKNYQGEVLINDSSPFSFSRRKSMILIERVPHLLPRSSVWSNLILPFNKLSRRHRQRLTELSDIAGVNNLFDLPASEISYSQMKLLEIIRAVVQQPFLILIDDIDTYFDEPTLKIAGTILDNAVSAGTAVLATGKARVGEFNKVFKLNNGELVAI